MPIRGNVDTRLGKLDAGEVDGLIVAAAGLDRLGVAERIGEQLDPRTFVPAPAQGAIALECVAGATAADAAAAAGDAATHLAVRTERAVLHALRRLPAAAGSVGPRGGRRPGAVGRLGVNGTVSRAEVGGDPDKPGELVDRVVAALR